MSGTTLTTADLDPERRRILFRAWHRGTREMDLIIGGFADAHLVGFTEQELHDFVHICEASDQDLMSWIVGSVPVKPEFDTPMFHRIKSFHNHQTPIHRA
jgi:antitoxin CptB